MPKLATWASMTNMEKSAMNVGMMLYLLSDGGRHRDISASSGGRRVP